MAIEGDDEGEEDQNKHLIVHLKREAVNSDKEANWVSIQRKRQIGCQFEERVNKSHVIIHPNSISQKKRGGIGSWMLREL